MKAKFINEKFIENSDPVQDMGIGIMHAIKQFVEEETMFKLKNCVNSDYLFICAKYGKPDFVKYLLEKGGEYAKEKEFALQNAVFYNKLEVVQEILKHSKVKDFDNRAFQILIHSSNDRGFKKIEKLLKSFMNGRFHVNEKFTEDSDPIDDLGIGVIAKIKKYCKEHYKLVDYNNLGACLVECAKNKNYKYVDILLEIEGIDLKYLESKAFRFIAWQGKASILKKFLDKGINVNVYNGDALRLAIKKGNYDCILLLLDHGAIITETHKNAAREKKNPLIKKLILNESSHDDIYYLNTLNESILNEEFNIEKIKNIINNIGDKREALNKFIKKFNETNHLNLKKRLSTILVVLFLINFVGRNNTVGDISRMSNEVTKENKIDIKKLEEISKNTNKNILILNPIDYTKAKTTKETKNFIKHHEKLRLSAYAIGDNKITIGYGHAYPMTKSPYNIGDKITLEKAEQLFERDIIKAENGVKRMLSQWKENDNIIKVDQHMFDAMVSMAFNMGISGFRQTEFVKHLKNNDYKIAAEKIKTARVSSKFPGLSIRRQKEYELFTKNKN